MSPCDIFFLVLIFLMFEPNLLAIWGIFTSIPYQLLRFCSIWIYNTIVSWGEEFRRLSEPTSRAASQSAEGGYCGKQHKRGTGAKRSEVGFGICKGEG